MPSDKQQTYQAWLKKYGLQETSDYDTHAAFNWMQKSGQTPDSRGHLPDTFKRPNHVTYSTDSMYSDNGPSAGRWEGNDKDGWTFYAAKTNVNNAGGVDGLKDYFKRQEPDAKLVLPDPDYRDKGLISTLMDINKLRKSSENAGNAFFDKSTEHNGPSDAMRHIIFNAKLTAGTGSTAIPWLMDKLHEYFETKATGQPQEELRMDLANGELGREIGKLNLSDAEMTDLAQRAVQGGKAVYLTKTPKQVNYAKGGDVVVDEGGKVVGGSLADEVRERFGLEPGLDRAALIPIKTKEHGWVAPQALYDIAKLVASPIAALHGKYISPEEGVEGALTLGSPSTAVGIVSKAEPATARMFVYHGTPHTFEATPKNPLGEFTASKIGTGEGAQAYGHGIYVAEDPSIAKTYTANLRLSSDPIELPDEAWEELSPVMHKYKVPGDTAPGVNEADTLRKNVSPMYDKMTKKEKAIIDKWAAPKGYFYTVDLPDEKIDQMLDWDKPLNRQSEYVQGIIEKLKNDPEVRVPSFENNAEQPTGQSLYRFLGAKKKHQSSGISFIDTDPATVSEVLRQNGILGIKYLDANSRPANIVDKALHGMLDRFNGDKELAAAEMAKRHRIPERAAAKDMYLEQLNKIKRNFVIFPGEEHNLTILDRKAKGGPVNFPDSGMPDHKMSLSDKLENLSIGLGKGFENQLEGMYQLAAHPIESGKAVVKGVKAVIADPSIIKDALSGIVAKATESPMGLGEVIGENINPISVPKRLAAIGKPVVKELTVYHGTPHRFPATERNPLGEFDASKIGTGEGAQAYGHGIYVAQVPEVAKDYQFMENKWFDTDEATYKGKSIQHWYDQAQAEQDRAQRLRNKTMLDDANAKVGFWEYVMTHQHPEKVINTMTDPDYGWPAATKFAKSIDPSKFKGIPEPGSFYTVDLPDEHIERMLDWDAPLSKQHPSVQKAVADLSGVSADRSKVNEFDDALLAALSGQDVNLPKEIYDPTGADIYHKVIKGTPIETSEKLRSAGIPGIKYFDAGSRDAGEGTRNFVIFPGEEHNLNILERKAEGGIVAQPSNMEYDPQRAQAIADNLWREIYNE